MRRLRIAHMLWPIAVTVALTGAMACGTPVRVTTKMTPDVNLSQYSTYAIVPPPEANNAVREVLEREVADEFNRHGYREVPLGKSELLVVIQAKTHTSQRHVFADSPGGGCCVLQDYVSGTLQIELFDPSSGNRLWRGVGQIDLHSAREKDVDAATSRAAEAVLKKFPNQSATP